MDCYDMYMYIYIIGELVCRIMMQCFCIYVVVNIIERKF